MIVRQDIGGPRNGSTVVRSRRNASVAKSATARRSTGGRIGRKKNQRPSKTLPRAVDRRESVVRLLRLRLRGCIRQGLLRLTGQYGGAAAGAAAALGRSGGGSIAHGGGTVTLTTMSGSKEDGGGMCNPDAGDNDEC